MIPKPSRLSDLAGMKHRADWSGITLQLRNLQPGQALQFKPPSPSVSVSRLRSTILMIGSRTDYGEWKLTTITEGNIIHCYLAPRV